MGRGGCEIGVEGECEGTRDGLRRGWGMFRFGVG